MIKFFRAFIVLTVFSALSNKIAAQTCGTKAPPSEWDVWFNQQVETFIKNKQAGKSAQVTYTIPVIVHVIHYNQTLGTFPNIDSNQVKSQIDVLNKDFSAQGLNSGNCPPSFTNSVANPGIKFCRAKIHGVTNLPLTERGIDRVNAQANSWTNPNTPTLNLVNYMNTVIIPATIWDPTKYLNIWISDKPPTQTINGFATYPAGTSISGLFNGNVGTNTNDGIWVYTRAFGTVGAVSGPYDKGRTATHELGHWLGLRHIWGDGNCYSDYCSDTPPQNGPTTGCPASGVVDQCGVNTAPYGTMPMNFMDNTEDACRYMFTNDQNMRIQAAMSQCPQRNLLGTHGLCTPTNVPSSTSSAVASFYLGADLCTGTAITPYNTSSGYPSPTFFWSSSPAASFSPATNVANPGILFTNPGTYTISLVATNSLSSSSYTMLVTVTGSCNPFNPCLDSLRMIKTTDTLAAYSAPGSSVLTSCSSGYPGFLTGTNCYKDKEFAQYFPPTSYTSTPFPQVNSVLVLFDKSGTKGTASNINCKIYGGSSGTGPGGVISNGTTAALSAIVASTPTNNVKYIGTSGYIYSGQIIPYRFDFSVPIIINTASGFFVSVSTPVVPSDSIKIISNTRSNPSVDSSAWFLQSPNNNWRTLRYFRGAKVHLAMIPLITCSPVNGLSEDKNSLSSNVNIMPNPSEGVFNLVFTLRSETNVSVKVVNAIGQLITEDKIPQVGNNVFHIDLSHESNGVYFAEIMANGEKCVRKLVVQH
jgi:hypothetical protein